MAADDKKVNPIISKRLSELDKIIFDVETPYQDRERVKAESLAIRECSLYVFQSTFGKSSYNLYEKLMYLRNKISSRYRYSFEPNLSDAKELYQTMEEAYYKQYWLIS